MVRPFWTSQSRSLPFILLQAITLCVLLVKCHAPLPTVEKTYLEPATDAQISDHPLAREARITDFFRTEVLPLWHRGKEGFFTGAEDFRIQYYKITLPENVKAIVIVHGKGETLLKYRELAIDFLHRGYNVYLLDHRGHGLSQHNAFNPGMLHETDFMHYVQDLETFIQEIVLQDRPQKLFLFAHSMGGGVSGRLLEDSPHLFKAAVLSAPMFQIELGPLPEWLAYTLAWGGTAFGLGNRFAPGQTPPTPGKQYFASSATSSEARYKQFQDEIFKRFQSGKFAYVDGTSYNWVKEALSFTRKIRSPDMARQANLPILLLQAEHDSWVRADAQELFCAAAPKCRLIHVKGAKHELWFERDTIRIPYLEQVFAFLDQF